MVVRETPPFELRNQQPVPTADRDSSGGTLCAEDFVPSFKAEVLHLVLWDDQRRKLDVNVRLVFPQKPTGYGWMFIHNHTLHAKLNIVAVMSAALYRTRTEIPSNLCTRALVHLPVCNGLEPHHLALIALAQRLLL